MQNSKNKPKNCQLKMAPSAPAAVAARSVDAAPSATTNSKGIGMKRPWHGFVFGGIASATAEVCTCPMDVVKVRMQLQGQGGASKLYTGSLNAAIQLVRQEGPGALFKGLSPAVGRQLTYGSLRYGLYEPVKTAIASEGEDPSILPLGKKILAGILCGTAASGVFTPIDVVKIRMQADSAPAAGRTASSPRYTGTLQALRDIATTEGRAGLYRGLVPNMQRAAVVAGAELATYDQVKSFLIGHGGMSGDALPTHLLASLSAGLAAVAFGSPADVVKSRMMAQPLGPDGRGLLYTSSLDCVRRSVRQEGVLSLWKGFIPNYARYGPNVVVTFLVLEQLRSLSHRLL